MRARLTAVIALLAACVTTVVLTAAPAAARVCYYVWQDGWRERCIL